MSAARTRRMQTDWRSELRRSIIPIIIRAVTIIQTDLSTTHTWRTRSTIVNWGSASSQQPRTWRRWEGAQQSVSSVKRSQASLSSRSKTKTTTSKDCLLVSFSKTACNQWVDSQRTQDNLRSLSNLSRHRCKDSNSKIRTKSTSSKRATIHLKMTKAIKWTKAGRGKPTWVSTLSMLKWVKTQMLSHTATINKLFCNCWLPNCPFPQIKTLKRTHTKPTRTLANKHSQRKWTMARALVLVRHLVPCPQIDFRTTYRAWAIWSLLYRIKAVYRT